MSYTYSYETGIGSTVDPSSLPFDYDIGIGTVATSRRSNGSKRDRNLGTGLRFAPTDVVTLLVANPKTPGKANYDRWERGYASGRTVAETVRLGVTYGDIRYDVARGFVRVDAAN